MNILDRYLHQPHAANCDCSVCWSRRVPASAPSPSIPCDQCRPASVTKVNGSWKVIPAFTCAKHTPPPRPPRYWHSIYDSGNPVPFVPIRELFELEG
ncbi:lysogeny maintenance protein PflM [Aquipseudomonas alcaligenes]|uniref:DUF5447 family protein n=1 Tax=Aquipseudomonas alcaligenes TaxID=43263 RepID=A0AB73HSQ1_AQUAC|nr:DUF5447 family protein [Pseudomonas alcaligenes]MDH0140757.1 DUF5447 family protein [Pseudomonas alcaligenes]